MNAAKVTKAYRARILSFDAQAAPSDSARLDEDGLLVIGANEQGRQVVQMVGDYNLLADEFKARHPDVTVQHLPDRIIAPGFVDTHVHYPQTDVIGSPAEGLLPWLDSYTFPEEKRFVAGEYAAQAATFFIAELLRNGVTTALTFATSHVASVDALFAEAQKNSLRLITGKCMQDRNSPDGVRDETEQSLIDTELLMHKWHDVDRLGYAFTPTFRPQLQRRPAARLGRFGGQVPRCVDSVPRR